jgi:hypothetical protein
MNRFKKSGVIIALVMCFAVLLTACGQGGQQAQVDTTKQAISTQPATQATTQVAPKEKTKVVF